MKNFLTLCYMLLSLNLAAQFPAPSGLQFSYDYFPLNGGGYCNGQAVPGPAYCSFFAWTAPDFNTTEATFQYYQLYYREYFVPDSPVIVVASTPDTFLILQQGFVGAMWVTARYSDPDGESLPSDTVENTDLPIGLPESTSNDIQAFFYETATKTLRITDTYPESVLTIYNLSGTKVLQYNKAGCCTEVHALPKGLYIAELRTKGGLIFRIKFLRQ